MYLSEPFRKCLSRLCEDVNTPRSLTVAILLRYNEVEQIVNLRCNPFHYLGIEAERFAEDNLVTEFIRKCDIPGVIPAKRLEEECFQRFLSTEALCLRTNHRLERFISGLLDQPEDARLLEFIEQVKRQIKWLVGPIPKEISPGFGPGATLTTAANQATLPDKIASVPCGTPRALYLYNTLFRESGWERYGGQRALLRLPGTSIRGPSLGLQQVARGNRFFTVPKEATKLRGACLSPSVNGYLQKGIGLHLRKRLHRADIFIDGQGDFGPLTVNGFSSADRHVRMAEKASRDGILSTIDLSDASNTIAYKTIELLWPVEWFSLLCDTREPFVERPDGRFQRLEMFSAMGNGFTFELETITFWAIVSVAAQYTNVSVFGDDIICESEYAQEVLSALRFFGFVPNERKTFTSGHFRESCGGDFFDGVPVRAHYVKEEPSEPQQWIGLANGLYRFAFDHPRTSHRWSYLHRAWLAAVDALPRRLRGLRGPKALGDLVLRDDRCGTTEFQLKQLELKNFRERDGIYWWRTYAPVARPLPWKLWDPCVIYASALLGVPSTGPHLRGSVSGYKLKWVPHTI